VGNLLGGALFDKYSAYKTILAGTFIAMSAAIVLAFNHGIVAYSILLIIIGFGNGITWPIMFAMAGSLWPEGGRRAYNAVYVAQNLGVAIGASMGGYIASLSFDYIFAANAAVFVIFFLIVLLTFKDMDKAQDLQMVTSVVGQRAKIQNKSAFKALLILCSGFLLIWCAYSQWGSTIASHTQTIGIPLEQYSSLWAINGFLIFLAQPLLKWFTDRVASPKQHIYIGMVILMISFAIGMFAENFTMFAASMVILTLGEILVWPAIPTLANELAPRGRVGFYQGIVNSIASVGRMIGPVLGGFIVDFYNMDLLFIILLIILVIPFITTKVYDRQVVKEKQIHMEKEHTYDRT
ncbi:MFS transporter, partial [Oceanobacillus massiliensis]